MIKISYYRDDALHLYVFCLVNQEEIFPSLFFLFYLEDIIEMNIYENVITNASPTTLL